MVSVDITSEFRASVQSALRTLPESKRRRPRAKKVPDGGQGEQGYAAAYLHEAYAILEHINTLNQMLSSIRHAYLNVDSSSSLGHSRRQTKAEGKGTGKERRWEGAKRLTDQERDEIDLQAKVILRRCLDRVKQLELLEAKRASSAPNKSSLLRLLPTRLTSTQSSAESDSLAAHYAGITWYVNRQLAACSAAQGEMQGERVRRQLERARSLGGAVGAGAVGAGMGGEVRRFDPSAVAAGTSGQPAYLSSQEEEEPLTAEQMQLFEQENSSILRSAENVLAEVQRAEQSLHEIGALQGELVAHLTAQTEVTDRLYEEAVGTRGEVERGNEQLRKARERGGDARKWLLFFLIGASLALLFLHYYQ
ncbi:hypothetical protein CALVIDRAFT_562418 [Calocera viscosa TUFC12733]|uniref:SNARE-complex protein Syntaxin-18 N-terminal domain-containing protein n=1 Tax=Calocera viscosa (strain TUFC12733) TaxID=1330018 RepID=A0A167NSI4_CALVF|nr:hypothetical protein CALVIDRAFT_562418 [Calocera viscosa TUFC12733]